MSEESERAPNSGSVAELGSSDRPPREVFAAPLPERPVVVALADDWAVVGARVGGVQGSAWVAGAAELRERSWRLEHRAVDANEALELYAEAARMAPAQSCDWVLRRTLLQGEFDHELGTSYASLETLHRAALAQRSSPCVARIDAALARLTAFKPLPSALLSQESPMPVPGEAGIGESKTAAPPMPSEIPALADDARLVVPQLDSSVMRGDRPRITGIERYGAEEAARVVISLSRPAVASTGFLLGESGQDSRVILDIEHAQYQGVRQMEVGGLLKRLRVGQHNQGVRLVMDLGQSVRRRVFYLPEPFRLVVDLSVPPKVASGISDGAADRIVRRVVLDPGHGGQDPGAIGPTGLREKDVTLDIAHRAAPLLARELAISTLLTRDTDDFVALPERTARANAFQADLFVSIHCNASEVGQGRGVMTFVLDESADALAAHIASKENAAPISAGAELASSIRRLVDARSLGRSARFAELIQRAAMASLRPAYGDVPDRGVHKAGFYVLAGARMPAVLFEASFISDPEGERFLNTPDYRQKLADAVVNAVRAYREGL